MSSIGPKIEQMSKVVAICRKMIDRKLVTFCQTLVERGRKNVENCEHSTNVVDEMSKVVDNGGSWSQFVAHGSKVVENCRALVAICRTLVVRGRKMSKMVESG